MKAAGITTVSDEEIRAGFAAARWPGRMELISGAFGANDQRDLILDGAHNEDGAAALAAAVSDLAPLLRDADGESGAGGITLIFAAMADKSAAKIFSELTRSRLLQSARVICTSVGDDRSSTPEALAAMARGAGLGANVETAADPHTALNAASRDRAAVIVAGSLYLVGAVRERLLREGKLPDDGSLDRLGTTGSAESQG
jgi:dihydrofolate synthase/folylpolyglutamate synthase